MTSDDTNIYTIVKVEQKLIQDTFPLYTLYVGFGMYLVHYLVVFVFLALSDISLKLNRIIWIGTYITPYIFHFWVTTAFCLLVFIFFKDYRRGFRQIKLEPNQITLYPKQKKKELQILSWEQPLKSIFVPQKNTLFKINLENQRLELPSSSYKATLLKITQFYKLPLIKEEPENIKK